MIINRKPWFEGEPLMPDDNQMWHVAGADGARAGPVLALRAASLGGVARYAACSENDNNDAYRSRSLRLHTRVSNLAPDLVLPGRP